MLYIKNKELLYEIFISFLALTTVSLNILDILEKINLESNSILKNIDTCILLFFVVEYFFRFFRATSKRIFIRENILDLIAIIPFNSIFKILRLAKLLKIVRITKLSKLAGLIKLISFLEKLNKRLNRFLKTNNFIYMIYTCFFLIFMGATGIYVLEKGMTVNTYMDAIWWSFVTATTVGYGDVSPVTGLGRLIAAILMITGIGTIGMFTGTIATFFIKIEEKKFEKNEHFLDVHEYSLTENEKEEVIKYIHFLKSQRNENQDIL